MKLLFATSEMAPFAKVGGLADVSQSLPIALSKLGVDIRVILPAYSTVNDVELNLVQITHPFKIRIHDETIEVILLEARGFPVKVYFVDAPYFFERIGIYGPNPSEGFKDNLERYTLFCKAVIISIRKLGWEPDIIHLNDWQTALIAAYLKTARYKHIGSLLTIHNLAFPGDFPLENKDVMSLDDQIFPPKTYDFFGKISLLKLGIVNAGRINTVSSGYREETLAGGANGAGLEDALQKRKKQYYGILNGVDYEIWSPKDDPYIAHKFSSDWHGFKHMNKMDLVKECQFLKTSEYQPVIGMVGRLVHQKGIEILLKVIEQIHDMGFLLVVLGTGDMKFEKRMAFLNDNLLVNVFYDSSFNEKLAHKIYAGSDIFLMPSMYEPCGLSQIIAMRYGAVPVVRDVGGLKDTVEQFDPETGEGCGFKFSDFSGEALLNALKEALNAYMNPAIWRKIVENAVNINFSWSNSAKKYLTVYQDIMREKNG
ncbi:MAG: glycogen synthase [Candidatus Marinimicrobia bacterium]|nr:glycogen synthase [Candidatus Neomarinimicrobiota bacterium]